MSRVRGGIYSPPRGLCGNIVWGAARTRTGKVATTREYVIPVDPQSADQVIQRTKLADSVAVVRGWGPSYYLTDWDRAVGQLPGFQSLMSVLLDCIADNFQFAAPPDTPLGALHFPAAFTSAASGTPGAITITWSSEAGADGTAADKPIIVACRAARTGTLHTPILALAPAESRASSPYELVTGENGVTFLLGVWWQGVGLAAGKLSLARWALATSGTT